jgi:hypothetical protein
MVWKMVAASILVAVTGWGAAHAQSVNDLNGPKELPPASFSGQQYVDSRRCVFLRAGVGGRVNWVPRVRADRKQLCGYPPSFGAGSQVAVENVAPETRAVPTPRAEPVAPAPRVAVAPRVAPSTGRKPLDTVASITTAPKIRQVPANPNPAPTTRVVTPKPQTALPAPRRVVPEVAQAPRGTGAERVGTKAGTGKIGCYADAPVAERFALRNGGSVVMCTKGDGDLTNARPPRLSGGAAAVAPSGFVEGAVRRRDAAPQSRTVAVSSQDYRPPKGYKQAWDDGRLNPQRGKGTRSGWADQDQVWTRDIPAQLVDDVARGKVRCTVATCTSQRRTHVSSKSEPTAPAPRQKAGQAVKSFVQVGLYGVPENADGASQRLRAAGLPVAPAKTKNGGRSFQVVMAGPFASGAEAQAALAAARRAGFPDAFIR